MEVVKRGPFRLEDLIVRLHPLQVRTLPRRDADTEVPGCVTPTLCREVRGPLRVDPRLPVHVWG